MELGVRTTRDFMQGEVVAEYSGELVKTLRDYKRRESQYDVAGVNGGFLFKFCVQGKLYWFVDIFVHYFKQKFPEN
jgi:hypothetical protein